MDKVLEKILSGRSDSNIDFSDLMKLLKNAGFRLRVKGDHHIYTKDGIVEIINIQPKGAKAKPYQVRQIRNIFVKYQLGE